MQETKLRIFNSCIEFDVFNKFYGKLTLLPDINNYVFNTKSSQHKTQFSFNLRLKSFSNVVIFIDAQITRPILDGISQSKPIFVVFDECDFPHSKSGLLDPEVCEWFHEDPAKHLVIGRDNVIQEACCLKAIENSANKAIFEPILTYEELSKSLPFTLGEGIQLDKSVLIVEDESSGYYALNQLLIDLDLKLNCLTCRGSSRLISTLGTLRDYNDVFLVIDFVEDNDQVLKVFRELLEAIKSKSYNFKIHFLNVHTFESILVYSNHIEDVNKAILTKDNLYTPTQEYKDLFYKSYSMERFYTTLYQYLQDKNPYAAPYSKSNKVCYPYNKLANELRDKLKRLKELK